MTSAFMGEYFTILLILAVLAELHTIYLDWRGPK